MTRHPRIPGKVIDSRCAMCVYQAAAMCLCKINPRLYPVHRRQWTQNKDFYQAQNPRPGIRLRGDRQGIKLTGRPEQDLQINCRVGLNKLRSDAQKIGKNYAGRPVYLIPKSNAARHVHNLGSIA